MSDMQCFSGEMTVTTPDGPKSIRDVEVGDLVLATEDGTVEVLSSKTFVQIQYSPVIMSLHRVHDKMATFLQIWLVFFRPSNTFRQIQKFSR